MTATQTERQWFRWALRRYGLLIARAVYRVFAAMGRTLLPGLDKVNAAVLVAEALRRTDPALWLPRLRRAIRSPVGLAIRAGAEDERVRHAKGSPQRVIDAISQRVRTFRDVLVASAVWAIALATLRTAMVNSIRLGLIEGGSAGAIARLTHLFSRKPLYIRSARIGHSEGHAAIEGGKDESRVILYREGYVKAKTWQTMKDSDVRDTHQHAQGQTVPIGTDFIVGGERASYPGDMRLSLANRINCFVPGTLVSGIFDAGVRSSYCGQVVEIVTRAGRRLSLTPNHPVLAEHGFVAASQLHRGDQLVAHDRQVDMSARMPAGSNHEDDMPARVEKVFEALMLRANQAAFPPWIVKVRRAQVDDFHGDGRFVQGDVEVVGADRPLLAYAESGSLQKCGDQVFALEPAELSPENRLGAGSLGLGFLDSVPSRFPRTAALSFDSGPALLDILPFQTLRIGPAARLDASRYQVGQQAERLSGLFASPEDATAADLQFVGQLFERNAGQISLDDVVEIRNYHFSGHVYDLQSPCGFMISNGICTSNCRCWTVGVR